MVFNPHRVGLHKILRHIPLGNLLDAPYRRMVRRALNIADLRRIARLRAHRMVFDYVDGGADDEITLRRNKDAYTELEMHYNILAGIKPPIDLSTKILSQDVSLPFFGCPTAGNCMFHTEGESGVSRAAHHHGALYCLSTLATTGIAEIGYIHKGPKLFQLYVWKDRVLVKEMLDRAKEGGFHALALTVDVSWMGNRERDIHNDFSIPPNYSIKQTYEAIKRPAWTWDFVSHEPYSYACIDNDIPAESLASFVNSKLTPDFSWSDAEWILGEWNGIAVPKGVVRPDDAKHALELGFTGIWISNHGGRQLESSPAPIDVLPSIREAVGPDVEIIVDSGVQRGTDIVKALALGANAVGVGKPYLYGLMAGGSDGVIKAFDLLRVELDRAMGLLGVATVDKLRQEGPRLVRKKHPSARDIPAAYASERSNGGGII